MKKRDLKTIDMIVVHCSATPEGRDVSAAEIDAWHRQRGFERIGYHYVVRLNGEVEEGRALNEVGAHCVGYNTRSIGVCYVGGTDRAGHPRDTRTDAQRASLLALLKRLVARFPGVTIHSHRDFAAKACPSFDATAEYHSLSG
jgi:N-acetylmuramoyl-L-alanine amidase